MSEKLFKDRITKTDYESMIKDLGEAIDKGDDALKQLLLGTTEPELYTAHGNYQLGDHQSCSELDGDSFTEKRLCKCLYFYNSPYRRPEECKVCDFEERYTLTGRYQIKDYEVPAHYYVKGVGKIDLMLADGAALYATEVKPYKGNEEKLLRMVAEIITYTLGTVQYKRAIAFFENTPQDEEYKTISPALQALLKKADITVFRFEKRQGDTYEICKL